MSLANGFHFLDFKTGDCELIIDPESDKPANCLNDGKVDKRGRFIAGSTDTMEEGPNGALYRLDPDLSSMRSVEPVIHRAPGDTRKAISSAISSGSP